MKKLIFGALAALVLALGAVSTVSSAHASSPSYGHDYNQMQGGSG